MKCIDLTSARRASDATPPKAENVHTCKKKKKKILSFSPLPGERAMDILSLYVKIANY